MMKQIGLWLLADEHRGDRPEPGFLMESPRDPMDYMPKEATKEDTPSFWNFKEVKKAAELMGAPFLAMDQRPMGHVKRKPTCLMVANLPQLMVWGESLLLKGCHGEEVRKMNYEAHREPWVCGECGLQVLPMNSGEQRERMICKLKEVNQCKFCETPLEALCDDVMQGRVECDIMDALKLRAQLEDEHWSWKRLWSDLAKDVAVGEEEGTMQGIILDYMEKIVLEMEDRLTELRNCDEGYQLAAMGQSTSSLLSTQCCKPTLFPRPRFEEIFRYGFLLSRMR